MKQRNEISLCPPSTFDLAETHSLGKREMQCEAVSVTAGAGGPDWSSNALADSLSSWLGHLTFHTCSVEKPPTEW